MKKKNICIISILGVLGIALVLITVFVFKEPMNGKMLCTYKSSENNEDVEMSYQMTFKNRNVTNLKVKEVVTSNDKNQLNEYQETLGMIYSIYDDLKYYDIEVLIEDNKLITNAVINYEKIDKEEFIKIDESAKNLYEGNKVPLSKLKKEYEKNGAKCKYVD